MQGRAVKGPGEGEGRKETCSRGGGGGGAAAEPGRGAGTRAFHRTSLPHSDNPTETAEYACSPPACLCGGFIGSPTDSSELSPLPFGDLN